MPDQTVTFRWTPLDATLELIGPPIGPAGVAVLDHGAVRLAFDVASGGGLARIVVDRDEDLDLDRDDLLHALADAGLPAGGGREARERSVVVAGDLAEELHRIGRLALLDDVLRADALTPIARLTATCEAAALGLGVSALATTWHDAAERLWTVVGDPELDALVDQVPAGSRAVVGELLGRCRRMGDPLLGDAVSAMHARWTEGPSIDPAVDPLEPLLLAAPPDAAARPSPAGAGPAGAPPAAPRAGPELVRVGDEAHVTVPPTAAPDAWIRVAVRDDRLLLAAVPVARACHGVVRLPIDGAIPDHLLMVDVAAEPGRPVRERTGEAMAEAVGAGRLAAAAERQGRLTAASEAWRRCATAWTRAGDAARAAQAEARARAPRQGEALAHERLIA